MDRVTPNFVKSLGYSLIAEPFIIKNTHTHAHNDNFKQTRWPRTGVAQFYKPHALY